MAAEFEIDVERADGGQAFPQPVTVGPNDDLYPAYPGMTLRDWFAGQALAGLCANPGGPFQSNPMSGWGMANCGIDDVARQAAALADSMLAERRQP